MKLAIGRQSQADPLWGSKIIPGAGSIKLWGCYLTCLSMYLSFEGYDYTPDKLNEAFKVSGVYNSGGLIAGDKVATLFNGTFGGIEDYTNKPAPIDKIKNILNSGKPVICEVDYSSQTGKQQHFILCVGYTETDLIFNDPIDGLEIFCKARYGAPEVAITGLRVYDFPSNKPETQPTDLDRTIQFLKEKGVDNEPAVREMYGAWQDLAQVKQNLTEVQSSLSKKQLVIEEKDRIISDLQTSINGCEAQIKSYKDFIEVLAQKFDCPPDTNEILGHAEQAIQNESKYLAAVESQKKAEEGLIIANEQIKPLTEALARSQAKEKEMKAELESDSIKFQKLQVNYDRLKAIIADKKPPSIISYILWRTIWRKK